MNNKLFSILKYLLLLLVGFGLLWLSFRNENFSDVWQRMAVADPFWLGASVVIAILAFISRAVRWILLMEPLGYKPGLKNTLYALLWGYFANLAIPRIGEIARCGALTRVEKVPFNSLIGTVIIERAIDLIMLFLTMMLVAFLEFDLLSSFIKEKILLPIAHNFTFLDNKPAIVILVGVMVLIIVLIRKFLKPKPGQDSPFKEKILGILREVGSGLKSILRMKKNGWFIFHTIFIWVLYFLMTWVCFFCLEPTSHLDMKAGLFILVVGGLGMSAPVQGGIGAYHYIVSQGLQLFDISSTDGIAYATLVHSTQTLLVIVLGIFSMVMLFIQRRKNKLHG